MQQRSLRTAGLFLFALVGGAAAAAPASRARKMPAITDKTLVARAVAADLTRRGGKDAHVISESSAVGSRLMFYKARSRQTGNMWDTWLYHHGGTYHLYYLAKRSGQWDNISAATSPDGVHWKELGPILRKGKGVKWMGTGSTWRSPRHAKDGKFFMNFSEWRGARQTIFFAESSDLLHWTRLGGDVEFKQDERWYEPNGRWDCIWTIPKSGGGLYGYWTATPKKQTGGRFGFGETADGVTWRALPPPKVHGAGGGEVGAVEKIGGKYYMMFGHYPVMVTLVADRPEDGMSKRWTSNEYRRSPRGSS